VCATLYDQGFPSLGDERGTQRRHSPFPSSQTDKRNQIARLQQEREAQRRSRVSNYGTVSNFLRCLGNAQCGVWPTHLRAQPHAHCSHTGTPTGPVPYCTALVLRVVLYGTWPRQSSLYRDVFLRCITIPYIQYKYRTLLLFLKSRLGHFMDVWMNGDCLPTGIVHMVLKYGS